MKFTFFSSIIILLLFSCKKEKETTEILDPPQAYTVSGQIIDKDGLALQGIQIEAGTAESVYSDLQGNWKISDLEGQQTIRPNSEDYTFSPPSFPVNSATQDISFTATRKFDEVEVQIFNWFDNIQLTNGLLESTEDGNFVSLYDNALSAMVFMLREDFTKAEKIFDFFNARINTELTNGVGGFSQFRDRNGIPSSRRWMGDNAWLLIALNNYKALTGKTTYDDMATALSTWLISLQDADGGLFAGYNPDNSLMDFKVTEGNIDAFNAVAGYTNFHSQLLHFLEIDRWDNINKDLVSWPTNPPYLYALDLHPWGYSIFKPYEYPVSVLTSAQRFLTTQTATNGVEVTGYCFDEDKDTVWPEGTGQMALAFGLAGMIDEKEYYLREMEKVFIQSTRYENAGGFPYASNPGTHYGGDDLWTGADTNIAISGGAWYLFATYQFNPFAAGHGKDIPEADMFWLD